MRFFALLAFVALLAGAGWHLLVRRSDELRPTIVSPTMNVYNEFSHDIGARVYRVTHQQIASTDRSDFPKLIALTFDDGPYPVFTPLLLDQLHALHVPATFF
ncbi:MAG: polysaccharide deacetylase family protein, partial [Vulcanimicrobiaceae bacterium]